MSSQEWIGPYMIFEEIGHGGMAKIVRARKPGERRDLAIKRIAVSARGDERMIKMFRKEARLSEALSHSNIVRVVECVYVPEPYIVLEWIDGRNLGELGKWLRARGEHLPVSVIAYIIGEVLNGLEYAHTVTVPEVDGAIIHRDISPQNIMVSNSGEVKILDFGIARPSEEETGTNTTKGKLRYMSPEQSRGRSKDPRVDLFAVGAVLHELFDGQVFRGEDWDNPAQVIDIVSRGWYPEPTRPLSELPPELDELRRALLAADPEARPKDATAALELLHRWHGPGDGRRRLLELMRRVTGVDGPRSTMAPLVGLEQQDTCPQIRRESSSANTHDALAFYPTESGKGTTYDTDGNLRAESEGKTEPEVRNMLVSRMQGRLEHRGPHAVWLWIGGAVGVVLITTFTTVFTISQVRAKREPPIIIEREREPTPPPAGDEPRVEDPEASSQGGGDVGDEQAAVDTPASGIEGEGSEHQGDASGGGGGESSKRDKANEEENPGEEGEDGEEGGVELEEPPEPEPPKPQPGGKVRKPKPKECPPAVISVINSMMLKVPRSKCEAGRHYIDENGKALGGSLEGRLIKKVEKKCYYVENC